jgi:hypothetical protein
MSLPWKIYCGCVTMHAVVKGTILFTLLCCYNDILPSNPQCASMRMIYPAGSHDDAVAISLGPHGTVPEIFSRNHLRIVDKSVWGDDRIKSSGVPQGVSFPYRACPTGQCAMYRSRVLYLEVF